MGPLHIKDCRGLGTCEKPCCVSNCKLISHYVQDQFFRTLLSGKVQNEWALQWESMHLISGGVEVSPSAHPWLVYLIS